MKKNLAKELYIEARKVASRYSKKNREGNVNGEDFELKKVYALSDYTAFVVYNKTTTKDAIAFFFYDMDEDRWRYFFPTDKHIAGFRYFEHINISKQSWSIVGQSNDMEALSSKIQGAANKYGLTHETTMYMTSDTAAVRFNNNSGGSYLAFFYYINRGASKGWYYFLPLESHINGFRLFEFEKFNVEKENYAKNFIETH